VAARGVPQSAIDFASEIVADATISSRNRNLLDNMDVAIDAYLTQTFDGTFALTARANSSTSGGAFDSSISVYASATYTLFLFSKV